MSQALSYDFDQKPQVLSKQYYKGKPIWYTEDSNCPYRQHRLERIQFAFSYGFHARCEDQSRRLPKQSRSLGISGVGTDAFYAGWDHADKLIKQKFSETFNGGVS